MGRGRYERHLPRGAVLRCTRWAKNNDWLAIDGGSSGGYTTLGAALTFTNVFSTGPSSLYRAVSDLVSLNEDDTHKFENQYLKGLVGHCPEDKARIYNERCPIHHTNKVLWPVLLLQGCEDKVVPPKQAEEMFHVLKKKGLATTLVMYKGEQHGFRKGENVHHALLHSEYSFFRQVFGIKASDVTPITIGSRIDI